jgi:hypothetical protein
VKHHDLGNWKRGTVFIKEIVPKPAISFIANRLYREKYDTMKMKHYHIEDGEWIKTCYQWKSENKWNELSASSYKKSHPLLAGSQEEFIAEHYWGFTKYKEDKTYMYEVSHPRWEIFDVKDYSINCDFSGIYGSQFSFLQATKPSSVFMAKGSEVKIHTKQIIS